jgi:bifunctional DNA-binding transcriptional regulator/antitoxin component of YhaV-PrlF toxin-antitoxin module
MHTHAPERTKANVGNRISQKGWIVIPADLRRKHGFVPGTEIDFVDYGGVLSLVAVPEDAVEAACGILAGSDSLVDVLIDEHKREREHEDSPVDAAGNKDAGPDVAGR